jgi:hypothetical protein
MAIQKLTTVIPAVFNRIRPGATFMSVMGYENNWGEVSNFGLVFHVNYINAVRRAVETWATYYPATEAERVVRSNLLASYFSTLRGHNPDARSAHAYDQIVDGADRLIKGVKWYRRGAECHLWGFRVHKVVLTPGEYESEPWGSYKAARRRLIGMTSLNNFRQFKLVEGRFRQIGVANLTLTHQHLLQELRA